MQKSNTTTFCSALEENRMINDNAKGTVARRGLVTMASRHCGQGQCVVVYLFKLLHSAEG